MAGWLRAPQHSTNKQRSARARRANESRGRNGETGEDPRSLFLPPSHPTHSATIRPQLTATVPRRRREAAGRAQRLRGGGGGGGAAAVALAGGAGAAMAAASQQHDGGGPGARRKVAPASGLLIDDPVRMAKLLFAGGECFDERGIGQRARARFCEKKKSRICSRPPSFPTHTITTGVAGAVSRTLTAPVDRLKMLLQVRGMGMARGFFFWASAPPCARALCPPLVFLAARISPTACRWHGPSNTHPPLPAAWMRL
jgi:hypothetical protein